MILKISDKIIRELLTCVAEYTGPAASQYLKILKDSGELHSVEWKQMADVFAQVAYLDILEEASFFAMKKRISDVEDFTQLIRKVEEEEMG